MGKIDTSVIPSVESLVTSVNGQNGDVSLTLADLDPPTQNIDANMFKIVNLNNGINAFDAVPLS